jgi:pimeloyl-ACP methyl ester carboxylesterase/predicted small lipoprotein YifL
MKKIFISVLMAALVLALTAACGAKAPAEPDETSGEPSAPVSGESAPAGDFRSEDITVRNGERDVPATLVVPNGDGPFPLVVMHHGFAGSRQENGSFQTIAETMAEKGIASVRMDFPGCGDSEASFQDEYSLSNSISDSNACLEYALANAPIDGDRLGIFGYSMGGRMALELTAEEQNPYSAMVLLAPAFLPLDPSSGFLMDEQSDRDNLIRAREDGYVEFEFFGNAIRNGVKYYEDQVASYPIMASVKNVCPTLVITGDMDTTIPPENAGACAEQIGARLVTIEGADHGYGAYSDQPDLVRLVAGSTADFFAQNLL